MPLRSELDLEAAEEAAIEATLRGEPALAEELDALSSGFEPAAALRFWRAFAAALPLSERPAAAVLPALEAAAGVGWGQRGRPRA